MKNLIHRLTVAASQVEDENLGELLAEAGVTLEAAMLDSLKVYLHDGTYRVCATPTDAILHQQTAAEAVLYIVDSEKANDELVGQLVDIADLLGLPEDACFDDIEARLIEAGFSYSDDESEDVDEDVEFSVEVAAGSEEDLAEAMAQTKAGLEEMGFEVVGEGEDEAATN